MPPYSSYSSQLDGSLRIISANNTSKHGNGSLLVQNGVDMFGSSDQYIRSTNASADLYVSSAKNFSATGTIVNVSGSSGAIFKTTSGNVELRSDSGDAALHGSTMYLSGTAKQENFTSALATTVADYTIKSSGANATLQADNLEARVFGHSLAHIRGNQGALLESNNGNVTIHAATDINCTAVNCTTSATIKSTLSAPEVDVNASTLVKLEAPTVQIGVTADVVTISQTGKQTNVQGNMLVSGNLTVSGTTTTVDTQNVLVKDNLLVLNSASEVGKDAGLLFHRSGADSTAMFWDESEGRFVLATTESTHDAATVVQKSYADMQLNKLVASQVEIDGFKTLSVDLADNASTPYVFAGLKSRGVYEFQVESVADGGAVYQYKICKSDSTSGSFTSFGIHQASTTDEEVSIKWDANSAPALYHKTVKTAGSGANLSYKVKYMSVN